MSIFGGIAMFKLNRKNGVSYYTITSFEETGLVKHGFSTREGGVSGGWMAGLLRRGLAEIFTSGPATFCRAASVVSGVSPGMMRQLMLAAACCGRAFWAWPASTWVATQVVRSIEL